jgi:hypothetical protein
MHLELSLEDARLVKSALDVRVLELRDELVHTDDRAYHASLREDLDRLESLDQRLTALFAAAVGFTPEDGATASLRRR